MALDPELLGRVFENLLASYNPETKTTARKQTGSFYTPREIVNYMVDESLIAYLKNSVKNWEIEADELDKQLHDLLSYDNINPFAENDDLQNQIIHSLDNCKILDPACGSGAFPMGILQKMVHILQKVDPENKYWQELQLNKAVKETEGAFTITDKKEREQKLIEINDAFDEKINDPDYARKLFLVENCIYGVDIQEIAAQISKLRFFISLVVDQKVDKSKENFGIRALPNLETKFVAANTLIGIDKPEAQGNLFESTEVKDLEQELKNVRHRLFSAKSPATKRRLRDKDKEIREKMGKLLVENGWANETAKQLASWDPYDQNASSPFFDPEWMFGIGDGFDIVIGNPPYGADIQKEFKKYDSLYHEVIYNYGEIYKMFYKNGLDQIKATGVLAFITSNTFISQPRFFDIRKFIFSKYSIDSLVNLGLNVFSENVVVPVCLCFISNNKSDVINFADLSNDSKFIGHFDSITFDKLSKHAILSSKDMSLYQIIKPTTSASDSGSDLTFDDILEIKDAGIQYHGSGIGLKNKGGNDLYERIFSPNRNEFKRNEPTWYGKLIESYYIVANTNEYFNLDYKGVLKSNESVSFSKKAFQEKNKILWRQTAPRLIATIDYNGKWFRNTIQCAWVKKHWQEKISLEYCLAICNSSLTSFYYNQIVREAGRVFPQVKLKHVKKLPFVVADKNHQKNISNLVSYLLTTNIKQSDIKLLFKKIIDAMVFELYFPDHMEEKEIDILKFVEQDLKEVLGEDDFEQLPDEQKENIIEEFHKRWSNPDNEIVKRMNSFAEKSPDILKPILESK